MAARELILASLSRSRVVGTPVLMYHALTQDGATAGDPHYCVRADDFRQHLRALSAAGRAVVDLGTFWRGLADGPAAVVSFDDGLASDYTLAYPRLLDARACAAFFVNTARVDQPAHLTWAQMREMQGRGMSFQSHAHDHIYLSRLSTGQLVGQLEYSKRVIEDRLGTPVEFLAAPFGDHSPRVVRAALAVGYRAICTSVPWLARPRDLRVSRIAVTARTSTREVMALAAGVPGPFVRRAVRAGMVYLPKRARLAFRARRGVVPALTVRA